MSRQDSIPDLILGTALWGWTIPETVCHRLLDQFYEAGFRQIDAATNYPINKKETDFRRSESILINWLSKNKVQDLKVIIKVGSLNNLGGPESCLTPAFLLMNLEDYREKLGENLDTLMIHWDNRDEAAVISESIRALERAVHTGVRAGLSGIQHPEVYAKILENSELTFRIEVKHNLLTSAIPHYAPLANRAEFLTYGMNAGGLKLRGDYRSDSSSVVRGVDPSLLDQMREKLLKILRQSGNAERPALDSFYQVGLVNSYYREGVHGLIIGPSSTEQLAGNIHSYNQLRSNDYGDVYQQLQHLKPN